jgi:ribosomal protein S18 acetylase RimI-like enzyme
MASYHKLDNPVWHSLTEQHQAFGISYGSARFYHPDYCPFGGLRDDENGLGNWVEYAALSDNFFIVGARPSLPNGLSIKREVICLQMILEKKIEGKVSEAIIQLNNDHKDALFALVNEVQPGYFRKNTQQLGNYYGLFKGAKLVAVTGERMCLNGFVEVSAIVTHPDHTGRGYAKQLITHTVNEIRERNCTPFLHVVENNARAIGLYQQVGFTIRRSISFWNIVNENSSK